MLKTILSWLGLAQDVSISQEILPVFQDSVHSLYRIEKFPSLYVEPRGIEIYLPSDYDSSKKYEVLYFQDGQNLFDSNVAFQNAPMELHNILKSEGINNLIVVGIWNTTQRFREFLPDAYYNSLNRKNKNFITREYGGKPLGNSYIKFLVDELIPFIESKYSIDTNSQLRAIGGISMGGLISFTAAIQYPEVFGKILCLSTHWPLSVIKNKTEIFEEYRNEILKSVRQLKQMHAYFDYGTDNIDAWYDKPQENVMELLKEELPASKINLMCKKFEGHGHSMDDWKSRIGEGLKFIFIK